MAWEIKTRASKAIIRESLLFGYEQQLFPSEWCLWCSQC